MIQQSDKSAPRHQYEQLYVDKEYLLHTGAPVICGISLDNARFSVQYLTSLLTEFSNVKNELSLMIGPAEINYDAIGLSESALNSKQRNLHRCIRRAIELLTSAGEYKGAPAAVVNWRVIRQNAFYQQQLDEINFLIADNNNFRADVIEQSRHALSKIANHHGCMLNTSAFPSESQVMQGSNYIRDECAFLLALAKIMGVKQVVYAYHLRFLLFERLLMGEYDGQRRTQVLLYIPRSASANHS